MTSATITAQATQSREIPLLPFLPFLALPFIGWAPSQVSLCIVLAELLLLAQATAQPLWCLGALIVCELTIRNFYLDVGGVEITTRLFLSALSVFVVMPFFTLAVFREPANRRLAFAVAAFAGAAFLANAVTSDRSFTLQFGRYLFTGVAAFVFVPTLVRSSRDLKRIAVLALLVASGSAVVAIVQHFSDSGAPLIEVVPNANFPAGYVAWGSRALGLTESPIYLVNDLLLFICPVVALLSCKMLSDKQRGTLAVLAAVFLLALYFSQTRSGVLSAGIGLAVAALLLEEKPRRDLLGVLFVAGVAFWLMSGAVGNRYSVTTDDSAESRPVLWSASLNIALQHPLVGIGHNHFLSASKAYAESESITQGLKANPATDALGRFAPHNDFLNVWVSFGTGVFVLYCLVFLYTAANFVRLARSAPDPWLRALSAGLAGSLVAYAANSFFHNYFDSTLALWFLAGLSIALVNIAGARLSSEAAA